MCLKVAANARSATRWNRPAASRFDIEGSARSVIGTVRCPASNHAGELLPEPGHPLVDLRPRPLQVAGRVVPVDSCRSPGDGAFYVERRLLHTALGIPHVTERSLTQREEAAAALRRY